jgi:hypothetical protein
MYVVQFRINAFLERKLFLFFSFLQLSYKNAFVLRGSNMGGLPLHKKERKVCELEDKDFNVLSYYYVTITCCGSHPLFKSRWPYRGCICNLSQPSVCLSPILTDLLLLSSSYCTKKYQVKWLTITCRWQKIHLYHGVSNYRTNETDTHPRRPELNTYLRSIFWFIFYSLPCFVRLP